MIVCGDVIEILKNHEDNSFDAVLCDPPYGLSFMGKKWDYDVPQAGLWREVLRVCKPGAALIAFSGTRTYHRAVVQIEDAGFEIRDQLAWMYGSGFPKSLDVSKALDKAAGAVREVVGERVSAGGRTGATSSVGQHLIDAGKNIAITAPATELAQQWHGYGTALKPAYEPAVLARKPLEGTVAANVAKWGAGGLAIDACRIGTTAEERAIIDRRSGAGFGTQQCAHGGRGEGERVTSNEAGRWPANVCLDEEAGAALDEQSGGASRFFYCAKVSRTERGEGNNHPTVKPIKLMEYLAKLIMPPVPVRILVPFAGSGSEIIGALRAGWPEVLGIEREEAYVKIALERIANANY